MFFFNINFLLLALPTASPIASPTASPTTNARILSVTSTSSGTVVESPHNYANSMDYLSTNIILGPGGSVVYLISFDSQTNTEPNYDFIKIRAGSSTGIVLYSYSGSFPSSITVTSSNGITFELISDVSNTFWGLKCTVTVQGKSKLILYLD